MTISNNILKECLKNVYFINGTACAGKSTMVRMLAEKHGMIHCGENYHSELSERVATPEQQPNLSYFKTMGSWREFVCRTPDEYARWIDGGAKEAGEFELALLLRHSASGRKVMVDTNLSVEALREISDYRRVAIMLCPTELSVEKFFDREDADKQFVLGHLRATDNPEAAMENYRACIARINSADIICHFKSSGFYTICRENADVDTRQETLHLLERHFGLI